MSATLAPVTDEHVRQFRVLVQALTANGPVPELPPLPGPAAVIRDAPVQSDVLAALAVAGFRGVRLTKYGAKPCFQIPAADLRETMVGARKPSAADGSPCTRGRFRKSSWMVGRCCRGACGCVSVVRRWRSR
jgi:hypothetical protein